MEHQALPGEDSTSESLSDFVGYSETGSVVESVGSAEIESWTPKLKQNEWIDRFKSRPPKRSLKIGTQFIHCVKELRGVPVKAVWEFIRDHRALASLIPGIIENFHHLEGEGGTGSVYIANYSPTRLKPGDDKYLINKVEVNDDASKLYAVRRVGGQYQRSYHVYMSYFQVLADDVLGDGSSVVVWRLEYERRNPECPLPEDCTPPEDTKKSYFIVVDLIKERYFAMNRVDRPIRVNQAVAVNMTKRLKLRLRAGQQRLAGAAEDQEPEVTSQQRRRKVRIVKNDEGSDRQSRTKQRLRPTRGRLLPG